MDTIEKKFVIVSGIAAIAVTLNFGSSPEMLPLFLCIIGPGVFGLTYALCFLGLVFYNSTYLKDKIVETQPPKQEWPLNHPEFLLFCKELGIPDDEKHEYAETFFTYPCAMLPSKDPQFDAVEAYRRREQLLILDSKLSDTRERVSLAREKKKTLKATQAILAHEDFKAVVWEYQTRFRGNYRAMLKRDQKKFPNMKPTKLIKEKDWSPYISTNLTFLEDGQLGIIIPAVWIREDGVGKYHLASGIEMSVDSNGAIFVPTDKDGDYFNGFVFQNLDEFIDHLLEEMEKGNYPLYTSQV